MGTALTLDGVRYRAGRFSLRIENFAVAAGEYLCVVGATGCGKTALLEVAAGLRRVESGRIGIFGVDSTDAPPESRRIGFAYQDSLLFPFLTVEENILFGSRASKARPDKADRERCAALMDRMGIGHLARRRPQHLSGGERQRASLARALLTRPRILLLDEPLSAVDAHRKGVLRDLLRDIHREEGTAVVHVTHDLAEAQALATRVALMENGTIVREGPAAELRSWTDQPLVAAAAEENAVQSAATITDEDFTTA